MNSQENSQNVNDDQNGNANLNGNQGINPNLSGGQAELPEYARQMFSSFMMAYNQVQEQIATLAARQEGNNVVHAGHSGEGGRDRERDTLYKRFNEFRPRYFDETTNPWVANKWVEHMEGIFEVMGCSDRQKAVLAAFKLEGDAKEWWKAAKKTFVSPENEITWTFFKKEFILKFIPEHIKEQKKREFQTLVQGSMTVAKYSNRFTELSHFAEELVATDAMKRNKFIEGLRPDIKKNVKLGEPATFAAALKRAFISEETTAEMNGTLSTRTTGIKRAQSPSHTSVPNTPLRLYF